MSEVAEKVPTKAAPSSVEPEINKNLDQERFEAFTAYIREQIPKMLDKLRPLYKAAHASMLGEDAMMIEMRPPEIAVSQFEEPGSIGTLARYNFQSNKITVFLPLFDDFSDMRDSQSDSEREGLRVGIETNLGHELGHMLIDCLIFDALISGKYVDKTQWPSSFVHIDSGERIQEALAQAIGTYACLSLRGSETDCASIAEQILGESVRDLDYGIALGRDRVDHYDAAIRDMGVDALRARGVEEPTAEEIRLAGLGRFNEVCESNTRWCIVYGLPRVGLATAMAGRGSGSLARFISDALERPESLGQAVSDMVLDSDRHIEEFYAALNDATLAEKNKILLDKLIHARLSAMGELMVLKRVQS